MCRRGGGRTSVAYIQVRGSIPCNLSFYSCFLGDLEVLWDAFADWDDRVFGPEDTPQNRAEYPENFEWSCCSKPADAKGCETGEHAPHHVSKKRRLEEGS